MKLLLHIGTEKTGTTSFQRWLQRNNEKLRASGVWHCQSLGLPDNRAMAVMGRRGDDPDDGFYFFGIHSAEDHAAFVERMSAALKAEIAEASAAGSRVFVISGEHMQSRLHEQDMVDRVAAILTPLFDDITVVCVLRPQLDALLSLASTEARVGLKVTRRRFEWIDPQSHYFNYRSLLERWANAFGKEAILPVPLRRNPKIVDFFTQWMELSSDDFEEQPRTNEALDYRTIAFSNQLDLPSFTKEGVVNPNRNIFYEDLPKDNPLSLGRDFAKALQVRFDGENGRLAAAWPTVTTEDLTPDWSRYPEQGTADLLEGCDTGPVLRYVVQRLNAELHLSRAQTDFQRALLARREGRPDEALEYLEKARNRVRDAAFFGPLAENARWLEDDLNGLADAIRNEEKASADSSETQSTADESAVPSADKDQRKPGPLGRLFNSRDR